MSYFIKKILALILTLFLAATVTFFLFQVLPGDSALSKLGTSATEESVEALRKAYGLDRSLPEQFFSWLSGAVRGDFGNSMQYGVSVGSLMSGRLVTTLTLAAMSFFIIIIVSFPLGIIAAGRPGGVVDSVIFAMSQFFMAIPSFFLGMLLTLVFGIILKWFTPGNFVDYSADPAGFIRALVFPAISIAIPKIAMTVKYLRNSILREKQLDYCRTARSKGAGKKTVMLEHVLKNALIPVITFLGLILSEIVAGSIIVEQVFNIPGVGRMLVTAIQNRDLPVVQAGVLYVAATVILISYLADMLYKIVDPRVS